MTTRIALACVCGLPALLVTSPVPAAERWYTFRGCSLLNNPANDGDSFHVRHGRNEYIFRLYFVDTPESDGQIPERVRQQAEHWNMSTQDVVRLGRTAADFTRKVLRGEFTVLTRFEDAMGQSRLKRFYAVVTAENESLDEALIRNGLAGVYGEIVDLPDGTPARDHVQRLKALEREARKQKAGGWAVEGRHSGP